MYLVNEGIRVQERNTCMLCGKRGRLLYDNLRDYLFGAPGKWSIMECPSCELAWLNPCPILEDIEKLYANYYTHNKKLKNFNKRDLRNLVKKSILASAYNYKELMKNPLIRLMGTILSRVRYLNEVAGADVRWLDRTKKGELLDIGCGNGKFLAYMRELGWEVVGIEIDSEAVKIAKEHFNLNVFQGTLEEANFPDDSFDAITLNHVIEHVTNPIELLKECRRILKPGGKLVIITPNFKSLGQVLFKQCWRGWEVPRHLLIFSPLSLKICIEYAGFKVDKLLTLSRFARGIWRMSRKICRRKNLANIDLLDKQEPSQWVKIEGFIFWIIEYWLNYFSDLGEEIFLKAIKNQR